MGSEFRANFDLEIFDGPVSREHIIYDGDQRAHILFNDRDFDIALQLVFTNQAAHDAYQNAPRHLEFIEAFKPMWKKVRVFDAEVVGA